MRVLLEAIRAAAVHCSGHVAQEQDPFAADAFMRRCSGGDEGGKELLSLKGCLDLKRSQAEEVVDAAEAGEAAVVGERAAGGRRCTHNSRHKTGELRTKVALARENSGSS